jgi:glucose-6-phosphate 1-dehydrogenase
MAITQSDALVFFGASGDLAYKQIFPALQALIRHGHLDAPIIGVAKAGWNLEQFQARARDSLAQHGGVDEVAFAKLRTLLRYVDGDYRDPATFDRLRAALGGAAHPLHYLAIPPSLFATVADGLARAGCVQGARVVVEKPFGRDLASAQGLNRTLLSHFPDTAIFRIDHYLGKEPVQNIIYTRFANSFLEPIWRRNSVASVQITMAEQFGVQGRGSFYEEAGAIRDVVQNHMLQIVACLAMEAPISMEAEAFRDEKTRVLKAMEPLVPANVVRGQYRGYRREPGVAPDSRVETFAALQLAIHTWRWAGVPFFIRAGKCLPVTATEIVVEFVRPPTDVFGEGSSVHPNYLRFELSPEVVIAFGARVKVAGEKMAGEPIELVALHNAGDQMEPYERLLGDAMRGEVTLFAREDSVEAAWRVVDPILGDVTPLHEYAPNTWGPDAPDPPIAPEGGWHSPAAKHTESRAINE